MAHSPARMPRGARLGSGVVFAALALLAAHDCLRAPWPPVLPPSWWGWWYNVVEFAATALCASRAVVRSHERWAWASIAAGLALFSAGDLYFSLVFGVNATSVPTPSIDDALYLSFYPATYVGIGLLVRERLGRLPTALWLDGLIGALAVAALGAALVLEPVVSATHGPVWTVATNLAYPLADLLLLGLLACIIAVSGWRGRGGWWLIAFGFATFAVTDAIYLAQTAEGTYVSNGWLDVGWPGAMAIMAVAAWREGQSARRHSDLEGWGLFAAPTVAALACLGLEAYDHGGRIPFVAHVLAVLCLLTVIVRLAMSFAENQRMLRASRLEATTDALTGLGNRRALELELERRLGAQPVQPFVLAFYDLDGFKGYNDTFGHQAGDALLVRLGGRLRAALPRACAFRMGGDEFCVVAAERDGGAQTTARAAAALVESGSTFRVGCSYGDVHVPAEAADAGAAMLLADARMYEHKDGRRPSAAAESQGVLMRALAERNNDLGLHNDEVAELAAGVCAELGLDLASSLAIRRAAELHDVGKLAIPDTILNKPGALDSIEWEFMRSHTIVGERIVASATSLRDVAPVVRSSHERWDGRGYPDGLAGLQIPLGARIIAVCDAYDAMTTTRPYREAMSGADAVAELRRCAGSQFDARVVEAFARVLASTEQTGERCVAA